MIGFLNGTMAGRSEDACFLDVNGVGYRLACSATTLAALPRDGETAKLWTHVHVREDALALYGFATQSEQRIFDALLAVSGVGPKVALQVCSAFNGDSLAKAVAAEDAGAIAAVPGIGKKTAQRIVIDLKERLDVPSANGHRGGRDALVQARSALENLGYSAGEARLALSEVEVGDDDSVEDIVKSALKVLA